MVALDLAVRFTERPSEAALVGEVVSFPSLLLLLLLGGVDLSLIFFWIVNILLLQKVIW